MKKVMIISLALIAFVVAGTIWQEDFEATDAFNTNGWTVNDLNNDDHTWEDDITWTPQYNPSGFNGDFGIVAPYHYGRSVTGHDEAITPDIDLTDPNIISVRLSYLSNFQAYVTNDTARVEITTDGGSSWDVLEEMTDDEIPTNEAHIHYLTLTSYAGNVINLKFYYSAYYGYYQGWYWMIDDVVVDTVVTGGGDEYDIAIVESVEPDDEYIEAGHEYTVTCRVYNYGPGTLPAGSYRVMATIVDFDDGSEVFSEVSGFDGPLDDGESKAVVFGNWIPEEGKSYEITYQLVAEDYPNDVNESNNAYVFDCTTKLPYDLAVEVVEPSSNSYNPGDDVPLKAKVRNLGQQAPEDSVDVKAYVDDNEVGTQKIVAPEPDGDVDVDFGTWTMTEGDHTVKYEVVWDQDMKLDNNTATADISGIVSEIAKRFVMTIDKGVHFVVRDGGAGYIDIYDITGKKVHSIRVTGDGEYSWNGETGIYFARVNTDNLSKVVKFVLVK